MSDVIDIREYLTQQSAIKKLAYDLGISIEEAERLVREVGLIVMKHFSDGRSMMVTGNSGRFVPFSIRQGDTLYGASFWEGYTKEVEEARQELKEYKAKAKRKMIAVLVAILVILGLMYAATKFLS